MVFKRKAARRSFGRSSRRSSRRSSTSGLSPMNVLMAGAIYGAARPFAAKMLPDIFSAGPIDSDNVIIGAAGFYGMKKGNGLVKALGAVALGSEAGIVAARVSSGAAQTIGDAGTDAYNY
jgi:hypothetical protein